MRLADPKEGRVEAVQDVHVLGDCEYVVRYLQEGAKLTDERGGALAAPQEVL